MKVNLKSPAYVIVFAAVTSAVFTGGIMTVYQATLSRVEQAAALSRNRAMAELFNLVKPDGTLRDIKLAGALSLPADRPLNGGEINTLIDALVRTVTINEGTQDQMDLLVGYKTPEAATANDYKDRSTVRGYAFEIAGMGFWAQVTGLLAVTPDASRVLGVVFLNHSETPGLGGRITTDRDWRETFRGLNVTAPADGRYVYVDHDGVAHPDDPRSGRHVDALSGATGTSTAVDTFLNADIARFRAAMAKAGLIDAATQPAGDAQ